MISVIFAFKYFYFPSGFYMVDFLQMHCFHPSLDTIVCIYSFGDARGTLRLHSRETVCLFDSWKTTYLTSIREQKYSVLKIWTAVWLCSLLRYKNKRIFNVFFLDQPRTSILHVIVKFEVKIDLFWEDSLFYRNNAFYSICTNLKFLSYSYPSLLMKL